MAVKRFDEALFAEVLETIGSPRHDIVTERFEDIRVWNRAGAAAILARLVLLVGSNKTSRKSQFH